MPRGLPRPGPFSGAKKAMAALLSSRHPYPWEARESVSKPQPCDRHDLSGIP